MLGHMSPGAGVVVGDADAVGGLGIVVEGVEGVFDGLVEEVVAGEARLDDVGHVVVERGPGRPPLPLVFLVDHVLVEVEDTGDAVGVEDPHSAFDPG